MTQTNYGEKKNIVSIVILLRGFFIGFVFFYIFFTSFYQILGNAPLIVKIHHKNIFLL